MASSDIKYIPKAKEEENILKYFHTKVGYSFQQWSIRPRLEMIDRAYMREADRSAENVKAMLANNAGDLDKLRNIELPLLLSQVETAVTYQASVFLTGLPIFGSVASPRYAKQAEQMDSLMYDHSIQGGWVRQLLMFFKDGAKYPTGGYLEVEWSKNTVAKFDTDITFSTTQAKITDLLWEGNKIKRLCPYNVFCDRRVSPAELHSKGEFAGYTELMSRTELTQYIIDKDIVRNKSKVLSSRPSSSVPGMAYYQPQINPQAFLVNYATGEVDWHGWMNNYKNTNSKVNFSDYYEKTVLYARIIPSDLGIDTPAKDTPQIWKFVFINYKILLYAERMNNAHNFLPILCGQPNEDGLWLQTKSLAENAMPMQQVGTGLMNSMIAARRRSVTDRVLYNPSLIEARHINNPNPSAKIPVRPAAFGRNLGEAVYQFPFNDNQSGMDLQAIQQVMKLADVVTGQNPARQGQFVKGNKTQFEFADVMNNANGRDQVQSMMYEAQVFTPLKHMIRCNILQYQSDRLLINPRTNQPIQIDPKELREAVMAFKISDGLTPSSKILNLDQMNTMFQLMMTTPQIGQGYNMVPMFSYLAASAGAKLTEFEKSPEQLQYEQALAAWQQSAATIAESLSKAGIEPQQIQEALKQLPPQPTPEQFGVQPNGNA